MPQPSLAVTLIHCGLTELAEKQKLPTHASPATEQLESCVKKPMNEYVPNCVVLPVTVTVVGVVQDPPAHAHASICRVRVEMPHVALGTNRGPCVTGHPPAIQTM